MTNYSINAGHVRGDLYSPNGKWRYTIVIDMSEYWNAADIHRAIVDATRCTPESLRGVIDIAVNNMSDYTLVVSIPYHKYSHPIMIKLSEYD